MTYAQQEQALRMHIPAAFDTVFERYDEAALSWNKEQLIEAALAWLRLYLLELPEITESNAADILERAIGVLLASGKVQVAPFGYSPRGTFEADLLAGRFSKSAPPVKKEPPTPAQIYSDVIADFENLSADELRKKKSDSRWVERFEHACRLGLIR